MKKAKHWYDYLWICAILYFTLGFFNILFAWLGMIDFLLPLYTEEGKYSLSVAVGCTGGRHRSVAVAQALGDHLREKGISAVNFNRDLEK